MFKLKNSHKEIEKYMEELLSNNSKNNNFDKIYKIANYLESSSKIFKKYGMDSEYLEINNIVKNIKKYAIKEENFGSFDDLKNKLIMAQKKFGLDSIKNIFIDESIPALKIELPFPAQDRIIKIKENSINLVKSLINDVSSSFKSNNLPNIETLKKLWSAYIYAPTENKK